MAKLPIADVCQKIKLMGFPVKGKTILLNIMLGVRWKGGYIGRQTPRYHIYGAIGIKICDRWDNSFEAFLSDLGLRPTKDHSLDRIDNDANYSCGKCDQCVKNNWTANCRWATEIQQQQNRSDNRWIEFNGERLVLSEWSRRFNVSHRMIGRRLDRMSVEACFSDLVSGTYVKRKKVQWNHIGNIIPPIIGIKLFRRYFGFGQKCFNLVSV